MTIFDPIPVTRDNAGSPVPSLMDDGRWRSHLDTLRWRAGLLKHDTGVHVRIVTGSLTRRFLGRDVEVPDVFGMNIGSMSLAGVGYDEAWWYLNGIEDGVKLGRVPVAVAVTRESAEHGQAR